MKFKNRIEKKKDKTKQNIKKTWKKAKKVSNYKKKTTPFK